MPFDFQGSLVAAAQITALILLTIGVYPYRIRTKNRNLIMHGFLSIIALALNLATTFYEMVPTILYRFAVLSGLPVLQKAVVWLHVGLGLTTVTMALVIIASWITHPLGELGCSRMWRLMIPTFIIWTTALILGLAIRFLNIL